MKELLLLLANYPYRSSNKEDLKRLLAEITDWDSFVKLVNAHGIIALAAYNIKEARLVSLVPAKAMQVLENGLMQSMVRSSWLAERWKEVNEILNEAGIKHILLKGMALEHTIYGARGLRQMTDNDILIQRQEAIKAWKLLQVNGFSIALPKSPLHMKIMLDAALHLPSLYKDGYMLEIHTRLFNETKADLHEYNKYFNTAQKINIGEIPGFILPDDVHIKYLLSHFKSHLVGGECQIRTWQDIKMIMQDACPEFPNEFIYNPDQKGKSHYRKAIYKDKLQAVPYGKRILFLAGDLFPSFPWMKNRYQCTGLKTILFYPHRIGKLLWLIT